MSVADNVGTVPWQEMVTSLTAASLSRLPNSVCPSLLLRVEKVELVERVQQVWGQMGASKCTVREEGRER